jgi:hypothetical protein
MRKTSIGGKGETQRNGFHENLTAHFPPPAGWAFFGEQTNEQLYNLPSASRFSVEGVCGFCTAAPPAYGGGVFFDKEKEKMRSSFTIHAGEYLAGERIQKQFHGCEIWAPVKDTGTGLLIGRPGSIPRGLPRLAVNGMNMMFAVFELGVWPRPV